MVRGDALSLFKFKVNLSASTQSALPEKVSGSAILRSSEPVSQWLETIL